MKGIKEGNIIKVPANLDGALELGLNPCDYCRVGWSSHTNKGTKSCEDTCRYHKKYWGNIK